MEEMNKQGQVIIYGLMLGMVIIILALALAFPLRESADTAMDESSDTNLGLNCANESISSFDKVTCYALDLSPFYFIGTIIMIGGVILTAKILFGEWIKKLNH